MTENGTTAELGTDSEWLVNQIAHALRNPIFAALVQAESISLKAADIEPVARSARILHEQLQRLETSIQEMLLYGRPAHIQRRPVVVRELLEKIASGYRSGSRGEVAQVIVSGDIDDLRATWDPEGVTIIMERVVDNAVQHSPEPHLVEIVASRAGDRVRIEVRDLGDGVQADVRDQAFLPFYPQHRGRPGLGLSIAAKFATALGGSAAFGPDPGTGTSVVVDLPLNGPDGE
jgi:signal transduction histidine kinase